MSCQWRVLSLSTAWDDVSFDLSVVTQWPRSAAEQYLVIPLQMERSLVPMRLRVAAVHPHNPWVKDHVMQAFPSVGDIELFQIGMEPFQKLLMRAYHKTALALHEAHAPLAMPSLKTIEEHEVVCFIDTLLRHSLSQGVTDIHFEPCEESVRIRLRQDGWLYVFSHLALQSWPQVCGRLKVLGHMDLTESRFPQNGRFSFHAHFQKVDCRVAAHPSLFGEKMTIRLLPQNQETSKLSDLGFGSEQQEKLHHMMRHPEGIIIICGPTGSGKTTTLYSLLHEMNCTSRNVMTLEDPVEYDIQDVIQTDLSARGSLSFPEGVRSLLRQDPDVILIGEIRDEETARMSLRAAVTGHQVLTTLHVRSIRSVFIRLDDLGIATQGLYESIVGIIHQRLIRLICPICSEKKRFPETYAHLEPLFGFLPHQDAQAFGCEACALTGYKGRTSIAEMVFRKDLKEGRPPSVPPTQSLWHSALHKVAQGLTNLQECERILGPFIDAAYHAVDL